MLKGYNKYLLLNLFSASQFKNLNFHVQLGSDTDFTFASMIFNFFFLFFALETSSTDRDLKDKE